MRRACRLELSDGNQFTGTLVGAPLFASGEFVFTTGLVGYSEAITDPSYYGQILTFTYPLIGNYGIPAAPTDELSIPRGFESIRAQAAAVIFAVDSFAAFHWNSFQGINDWLKSQNIPGIVGLDTRHLVHLIRSNKNLLGRVIPEDPEGQRYKSNSKSEAIPSGYYDPGAHELIKEVSTPKRQLIGKGRRRVALVDCGVKWNIVRLLVEGGCEVELLPWDTDLDTVDCDGWLISNGPGDPMLVGSLRDQIATLYSQSKPMLGICLGHQLMSLAAGACTRRMPFGHRSHNQPVYEVGTRKGCITTQNHGYVVEEGSLVEDWEVWFRNINDESIEGIRHKSKPFRSVQFHPEACGGPRDTGWVLGQFIDQLTNPVDR